MRNEGPLRGEQENAEFGVRNAELRSIDYLCGYVGIALKLTPIKLSLLGKMSAKNERTKGFSVPMFSAVFTARHNPSGASRHLPLKGRLNKSFSRRNPFG